MLQEIFGAFNKLFVFFPAVLDVLGIKPETIEDQVKNWTSCQTVNEDLVLSILDLLFAKLLKGHDQA